MQIIYNGANDQNVKKIILNIYTTQLQHNIYILATASMVPMYAINFLQQRVRLRRHFRFK